MLGELSIEQRALLVGVGSAAGPTDPRELLLLAEPAHTGRQPARAVLHVDLTVAQIERHRQTIGDQDQATHLAVSCRTRAAKHRRKSSRKCSLRASLSRRFAPGALSPARECLA